MSFQKAPIAIHMWFADGEGWALDTFFSLPGHFMKLLDSVDGILKSILSEARGGEIRFTRPCFDGWLIGIRSPDLEPVNSKAIGRSPSFLKLAYVRTRFEPTPELIAKVIDSLSQHRPKQSGTSELSIDVALSEPLLVPKSMIQTSSSNSHHIYHSNYDYRSLIKLYESQLTARFQDDSILAENFILAFSDGSVLTKSMIDNLRPMQREGALVTLDNIGRFEMYKECKVFATVHTILAVYPLSDQTCSLYLFDISRQHPKIMLHRLVKLKKSLFGYYGLFGHFDLPDEIQKKWLAFTGKLVSKSDPALDQYLTSLAWIVP